MTDGQVDTKLLMEMLFNSWPFVLLDQVSVTLGASTTQLRSVTTVKPMDNADSS